MVFTLRLWWPLSIETENGLMCPRRGWLQIMRKRSYIWVTRGYEYPYNHNDRASELNTERKFF